MTKISHQTICPAVFGTSQTEVTSASHCLNGLALFRTLILHYNTYQITLR